MSGLVCQEVVELASDHVDGSWRPRSAAPCSSISTRAPAASRAYIDQMRTTVALLSRLPGPRHDALPAMREAFRAHGDG